MFDAFPFDAWPAPYGDGPEDMAEFWTFGGEGSTGTWILTVIGFVVMLVSLSGASSFSRTGSSPAQAGTPARVGAHSIALAAGARRGRNDGRETDRLPPAAERGTAAWRRSCLRCRSSAS